MCESVLFYESSDRCCECRRRIGRSSTHRGLYCAVRGGCAGTSFSVLVKSADDKYIYILVCACVFLLLFLGEGQALNNVIVFLTFLSYSSTFGLKKS